MSTGDSWSVTLWLESGRDELLAYLRGEAILLIQKSEGRGSRKLLILDGLITRSFSCHWHQVVQRLKEVRAFEVVLRFLLLNWKWDKIRFVRKQFSKHSFILTKWGWMIVGREILCIFLEIRCFRKWKLVAYDFACLVAEILNNAFPHHL